MAIERGSHLLRNAVETVISTSSIKNEMELNNFTLVA